MQLNGCFLVALSVLEFEGNTTYKIVSAPFVSLSFRQFRRAGIVDFAIWLHNSQNVVCFWRS
jgi:hypothetical protein